MSFPETSGKLNRPKDQSLDLEELPSGLAVGDTIQVTMTGKVLSLTDDREYGSSLKLERPSISVKNTSALMNFPRRINAVVPSFEFGTDGTDPSH